MDGFAYEALQRMDIYVNAIASSVCIQMLPFRSAVVDQEEESNRSLIDI